MSEDQKRLMQFIVDLQTRGDAIDPATSGYTINSSVLRACIRRGWINIVPTERGFDALQKEKGVPDV
jgi:hypothetical protein